MRFTYSVSTAAFALVFAVMGSGQVPNRISDELMLQDSKAYLGYDSGDPAEKLIASGQHFDAAHNTFLILQHPSEEIAPGHAPLGDRLHEFKTLALNSDLIALATPLQRKSSLTDSHKFIFSDYEVRIDTVFKDRVGGIAPGTTIVLSRPGGNVQIDGSNVRAIETEFPLFHLGEQYLFFLHRSSSGSFKVNPSDCYLISDNKIQSGRNHPKTDLTSVSPNDVLDEVKTAVAEDRRAVQ